MGLSCVQERNGFFLALSCKRKLFSSCLRKARGETEGLDLGKAEKALGPFRGAMMADEPVLVEAGQGNCTRAMSDVRTYDVGGEDKDLRVILL